MNHSIDDKKLSGIFAKMVNIVLKAPNAPSTAEAITYALILSQIAWNNSLGIECNISSFSEIISSIKKENPKYLIEIRDKNENELIEELISFKKQNYLDDRRQIIVCGLLGDKIHIEWLNEKSYEFN